MRRGLAAIIIIGLIGAIIALATAFYLKQNNKLPELPLISKGIVDPCKNIEGTEVVGGDLVFSKKDLCYRDQAIKTNDISWCQKSKATSKTEDVRCVINVAISSGNLAICDSLDEDKDRTRSQCLSEVAEAKKLPEICQKIPDPYYKGHCEEFSTDETFYTDEGNANWKTYTGTKYGFSFEYPQNWTYSEESYESGPLDTAMGFDGITLSPPKTAYFISTSLYLVRNKGLSIKEYFNEKDYSCCGPGTPPTYLGDRIIAAEKVLVNGIEGRKLSHAPIDIPIEFVSVDWIVVEKNKKLYVLSVMRDTRETQVNIEKVFNQILSTFKFIN